MSLFFLFLMISAAQAWSGDVTNDGTNPLTTANRIRKQHIDELRAAINQKRVNSQCGLAAFAFPEAIVAGTTPIRASHITEMRQAINDVYAAKGDPLPVYTNAGLGPGTLIRAAHINDLRNATDNAPTCPVCANGIVEPPEQCEPPNTATCNAFCMTPVCSNGILEPPSEQCDPPGPTCDWACQNILCGNGVCDVAETSANCPADCPVCNNNSFCDPGETNANCPGDCPVCNNNGTCDPGETNANCPADCPPCNNDGFCGPGENNSNCPGDCPPVCNSNGFCDPGENNSNCPSDCPLCNNNTVCDPGESNANCPGDCPPGATCSDGTKNGDEDDVDCGGTVCAPCACVAGPNSSGIAIRCVPGSEMMVWEAHFSCNGGCGSPTACCSSNGGSDCSYQGPAGGGQPWCQVNWCTPNPGCCADAGGVWNMGNWTCTFGPVATCSDGIQNQGETGVDCGGPCTACAIMGECTPGDTQSTFTGVSDDCGDGSGCPAPGYGSDCTECDNYDNETCDGSGNWQPSGSSSGPCRTVREICTG